ncbi:unnamed protein product [Closterium sp. Yama58-4]|nr:unnamed protein product [Closterium sp. Yama58-4]
MEKHRIISVFLLLCTLASVASSKTLYMRATAILSGVNVFGGTNFNLGFGRAVISVYIDGPFYEVRTFVTANNMFSNGNIPLYGVYIGRRFTSPANADGVRVPPFVMNWKNDTLNGPINRQDFHHLQRTYPHSLRMPCVTPPHARKQYASFSAAMPLRTPLPLDDVVDGWGMDVVPLDPPRPRSDVRIDRWPVTRPAVGEAIEKKKIRQTANRRWKPDVELRKARNWVAAQSQAVVQRAGEAWGNAQKECRENIAGMWSRLQEDGGLKTVKHIFAGATASVVARSAVAPLERLKLEYMVCGAQAHVPELTRRIFAREGMMGFWKGNGVNLLRIVPFKTINFVMYDIFRQKILDLSKKTDVNNVERLSAGAVAGVIATFACFPLDTVRTRMIAQGGIACTDLVGCLSEMIRSQGFFGLYRGIWPADKPKLPVIDKISFLPSGKLALPGAPSTSQSASLSAGLPSLAKADGSESQATDVSAVETDAVEAAEVRKELGPMRTLLYGAIAGVVSEFATYPLEVVRRQMQMSGIQGSVAVAGQKAGAMRVLKEVVQRGGLPALYAGMVPGLLQVLPSAALSYWVYDFLKLHLKVD